MVSGEEEVTESQRGWSDKMSAFRLEDNILNRELGQAESKFKIWSSAGLMLSYRCPGRCACCYVYSGPKAGGADTEMSVELALACWRGVRRLAGERGKVHITGGEPFCDYERLKKILQLSCEEKLAGLEKIETNAYWCTDEALVRDRLSELREYGLSKLQVSTDVYHQEYISIDHVRLAVAVGKEVLGENGVQVRWWDFLSEPVLVSGMSETERTSAFVEAMSKRKERLLGRAAAELATLLPSRNYDSFTEDKCSRALLGARHVHIDGAGHVFLGTCIGMIAGKVDLSRESGLDELWRGFDYRQHELFSILAKKGPCGLMARAVGAGYRPKAGYGSKCHLCYDIRRFLYQKGEFRPYLGPGVCYGG